MIRPVLLLCCCIGVMGCESDTVVTNNITLPTGPSVIPFTNSSPTCQSGQSACPPCPTGQSCNGTGNPIGRTPEIMSFSSDTPRVTKNNPVVLRWETSDPTASVRIDPNIGSVSPVGFIVLFPSITTTYTLTARNSSGIAQRQLTIFVFSPET